MAGPPLPGTIRGKETGMFKFIGGVAGIIFLVGLIVVIGLFAIIF